VIYSKALSKNFLDVRKGGTKENLRIAGELTEIRHGHLPNASGKLYFLKYPPPVKND
jgi:hypothetical protein